MLNIFINIYHMFFLQLLNRRLIKIHSYIQEFPSHTHFLLIHSPLNRQNTHLVDILKTYNHPFKGCEHIVEVCLFLSITPR